MKRFFFILIIFFLSFFFILSSDKNVVETLNSNNTPDLKNIIDDVSIPVLMYHHFTTEKEELSGESILPHEFEEQLKYLKEQGYQTVTNQDVISYMQGEKNLPEQPLLITIDDGYESNYKYAYPILKELEMKATLYLVGSSVRDNNNSLYPPDEIHKLSWEQVQEMYHSGLIDVQSHSYDMHKVGEVDEGKKAAIITEPIYVNGKKETIKQYKIRVKNDLIKNKKLIENNLGNKVVGFAYPYGKYSEIAENLLVETGHQLTLTVEAGINKKEDGTLNLNRINVPSGITGEMIDDEIKKHSK